MRPSDGRGLLTALEYGFPPTGAWIGIDRLAAIITISRRFATSFCSRTCGLAMRP